MLQIAICDDEKELRQDLRKIIETDLELWGISHEIREYDCGERLVSSREKDYDLVFLDIEMKELNGMDTARQLRQREVSSVIIFVTAYPDFVFQGYEVQAYNYILKPYQAKKILQVLHGALEKLEASREKYYLIQQKSGVTKLPLSQTKYFVSERREVTAVTLNGPFTFYEKLSELEQQMPGYFIRIHNRYLVNLNFVTALDGNTVMCGGEPLPVSRSCKQETAVAFARCMLR